MHRISHTFRNGEASRTQREIAMSRLEEGVPAESLPGHGSDVAETADAAPTAPAATTVRPRRTSREAYENLALDTAVEQALSPDLREHLRRKHAQMAAAAASRSRKQVAGWSTLALLGGGGAGVGITWALKGESAARMMNVLVTAHDPVPSISHLLPYNASMSETDMHALIDSVSGGFDPDTDSLDYDGFDYGNLDYENDPDSAIASPTTSPKDGASTATQPGAIAGTGIDPATSGIGPSVGHVVDPAAPSSLKAQTPSNRAFAPLVAGPLHSLAPSEQNAAPLGALEPATPGVIGGTGSVGGIEPAFIYNGLPVADAAFTSYGALNVDTSIVPEFNEAMQLFADHPQMKNVVAALKAGISGRGTYRSTTIVAPQHLEPDTFTEQSSALSSGGGVIWNPRAGRTTADCETASSLQQLQLSLLQAYTGLKNPVGTVFLNSVRAIGTSDMSRQLAYDQMNTMPKVLPGDATQINDIGAQALVHNITDIGKRDCYVNEFGDLADQLADENPANDISVTGQGVATVLDARGITIEDGSGLLKTGLENSAVQHQVLNRMLAVATAGDQARINADARSIAGLPTADTSNLAVKQSAYAVAAELRDIVNSARLAG